MKNLIFILTLLAATLIARADDLDAIQGKWTVKKTGDNGAFTQHLEFKKNKWTFKIVAEGNTAFVAEGEVEIKKQGPFSTMRLFNIKAGRTESELDPVEEERNLVFVVSDDQLFAANNFDKQREREKPSVDAYSKSN